jgi:fructokinase
MLGAQAVLVSCVGNDSYGKQICDILGEKSMEAKGVAIDSQHSTGTVTVTIDKEGRAKYSIADDVAWDYIPWTNVLANLALHDNAVCFGTLAQRHPQSLNIIRRFLTSAPISCLRVFDVNLRQNYYSRELVLDSLKFSNVLKINNEELAILASYITDKNLPEFELLNEFIRVFNLDIVALTKGKDGCVIASQKEIVSCPGFKTVVKDTVGAGDAFTAAMILGLLKGLELQRVANIACQIGAYVCSQSGATPPISQSLVQDLYLLSSKQKATPNLPAFKCLRLNRKVENNYDSSKRKI